MLRLLEGTSCNSYSYLTHFQANTTDYKTPGFTTLTGEDLEL